MQSTRGATQPTPRGKKEEKGRGTRSNPVVDLKTAGLFQPSIYTLLENPDDAPVISPHGNRRTEHRFRQALQGSDLYLPAGGPSSSSAAALGRVDLWPGSFLLSYR